MAWAPALFGESLLVKDDDGKVSAPNCIRMQAENSGTLNLLFFS